MREVLEECDITLEESEVKVMEVMNIIYTEADYHNVGVFTLAQVKKDTKFKTMEPHKNTEWRWVPWSQFIELKPLFIPFKYFFEKGYRDLEKIKAFI